MTVSERDMIKSSASSQDVFRWNSPAKPEKRHRLSRSLTGNFTPTRSLLYSPTNSSSSTPLLQTRNSLDIIPRTSKAIPTLPLYHARPVLVKNTYANISSRPSKFIKPAAQHQYSSQKSTTDLESIAKLFLRYNHKMYAEGYLSAMIELNADGKHIEGLQWKQVFAELSGSTLAIWNAEKTNRQEDVLPSYINITDAVLELIEQQVFGKPNCFAIQNTASANRFIFQAKTKQELKKWETCFWLAGFEGTKLHEIYTRKILLRPMYKPLFNKQPSTGLEGYLQVRFAGKSDWQRLWAVLDKKEEKKLWGRRAQTPFPGSILLYEDKKSKAPLMSVSNVARAYAIYPENPQLSEHATLFKIEGSVTFTSKETSQDIPDRISHVLFMTKNSKEMGQWLIAIFDVFKLNGRPQQLFFEATQPNLTDNADTLLRAAGKLFLDVSEVQDKGLCDKQRWDQKGVFADELQRKVEMLVKPVLESPKLLREKSKSLPPNELLTLQSSMSTLVVSPTTVSPIEDNEKNQLNPTAAQQENISINIRQIEGSSDDDTEDDIAGDTDEDESDDSSTFNIRQTGQVSSQPLAGPKQRSSEKKQLARQSSTSSSFLLDFGNLSGSRNNMGSRTSSSGASSSSIFGEFAHSTDFSKYIDPSVLNDGGRGDVNVESDMANGHAYSGQSQSYMGNSHSYMDSIDSATEQKEGESSLPKNRSRNIFPPWNWGMFGNYDEADYRNQQEEIAKKWKIEDMQGREGLPIPSLGDNFASQNSLLDQKPSDQQMTAQEQTAYARATRQPFLHVPVKPKDPQAGLLGRISQLESERRDGGKRVSEKVNAYHAELEKERFIERERDRRLMEQRQQQMFQQMMMMNGGFAMMPVIQTPHGIVPVMMPYPMSPQGSMSTPVGRGPPVYDPRIATMAYRNSFSNTPSPANRSPFTSSSSGSSSYTASSIHSQFSNNKNAQVFGTAVAAESSGDEEDHIPIAKSTPSVKRRSAGWSQSSTR